jgi:hypothetical protein
MTSLISATKQIPLNSGYYITVGSLAGATGAAAKFYVNAGTDDLPNISANIYATSSVTSTFMNAAGAGIFRDMGKTLRSSGRVFRKVQLLTSTNSVTNLGTDGVGGVDTAPFNYLTGYIELPGTGAQGYSSGTGSFSPVARLG